MARQPLAALGGLPDYLHAMGKTSASCYGQDSLAALGGLLLITLHVMGKT